MDFEKYRNTKHWVARSHPEYKTKREEYEKEEAAKTALFKHDALIEVGLSGHEAAERAFKYALQEGHSDGYSCVFDKLLEIAYVITGKGDF